ncbi:MAG: hypothetical protein AAGC55_28070 [Myxococcota bacterium]
MFNACPELAAYLLRDIFDLPEQANPRIDPDAPIQLNHDEPRPDVVVTFSDDAGHIRNGAIIQIQLHRDETKQWTWPLYLAELFAGIHCPVVLAVITIDPEMVDWCAEPINIDGRKSEMLPLVLGPDAIPRDIDPATLQKLPELGVLSVVMHGRGADAERLGLAAMTALDGVTGEHAQLYRALIHQHLSEAARLAIES